MKTRTRTPQENTVRVVALALAFFGGLAMLAIANGVFARLGPEVTAAIAAFAAVFAWLTWRLDPAVRTFVRGLFPARAGVVTSAPDRTSTRLTVPR